MGKSTLAFVAFLALCGLAAVSADFVNFPVDNAGDEVALRERRDADGDNDCDPRLFKKLKPCCTVPEVIPESAFGTCFGGMKKGKHSGKNKKNKGGKNKGSTKPDEVAETSTTVATGRKKREAGGEKCGMDCVLKGQNLLTATGDLDVAATTAKFTAAANGDAAWQAVFDAAMTDCQAKLGAGPASDAGKTKCKQGPRQLLMCLAKALYSNCPAAAAAGAATDASCAGSLDEVKKCDPFVIEKKHEHGGAKDGAPAAGGALKGKKQKGALKRKVKVDTTE